MDNKNYHKQFPGKMDKSAKKTYKTTFKMGYGKLKHVKMFENFDESEKLTESFTEEELDSIKEVIKKTSFMSLTKPLEELGFFVTTEMYDQPMPPVIINVRKNKNDKQKVTILNRKYVGDSADFVHGEIAMGIMEKFLVQGMFVKINEESAEAVGTKNLRITKSFKKKVDDMVALAKQFESKKEEYEVMSKLLGKYESDVQSELEQYGAQFIRIGNVAIELKRIAGKETKSYKNIAEAEEALLPVTAEMQLAIKNINDLNTKINPDKIKMEYSVEESALTELFDKVGTWFKDLWTKIKAHVPVLTSSVDDLATKLQPLDIKIPSTTEALKQMKK